VGQPLVPMALAPDGAFFLGLKVGRRSADLIVTDFLGRIRGSQRRVYRYPTPDAVVGFVAEAWPHLVAGLPEDARDRVTGMGVAIPFQPTVTSGMVWTPICLSTDVATADVEVPNGSWITPGAGSLSIAPPGPASDAYAWSILDVAGRELTSGRAAGGKRTDTGFTAAGVHVLVLRSADAQHTERFVLP